MAAFVVGGLPWTAHAGCDVCQSGHTHVHASRYVSCGDLLSCSMPCMLSINELTLLHTSGEACVPCSRFNGTPIRNLRQLASLIASCADSHMRFDLDYNEVGGACFRVFPCLR